MFNSNYSNPSTSSTSEVNPLDKIEERIKSGKSRSIPIDMDKLDTLLKEEQKEVTDNDLETICLLISEVQKEKERNPGLSEKAWETLKKIGEVEKEILYNPKLSRASKIRLFEVAHKYSYAIMAIDKFGEQAEKEGLTVSEFIKRKMNS